MVFVGLAFVVMAALGTLLRAETTWALNRAGRWPWGTFAVNLLAAGGLGVIVGVAGEDTTAWSGTTVALAVGGLGALGTVSGLAAETLGFLDGGRRGMAAGYLATTLVLGVLVAAAGLAVGR